MVDMRVAGCIRLVAVFSLAVLLAFAAPQEAFADGLSAGELAAGEQAGASAVEGALSQREAGVAEGAGDEDGSIGGGEAGSDARAEAAAAERKAKLERRTIRDGLYNLASVARPAYSVSVKGESKKAGALVAPASRDESSWSQKWAVSWDSETGYYKVRNMGSRKFLGVAGEVRAGAHVKQYRKAQSRACLWQPVKVPGGIMLEPAGSDFALAVSGGKKGLPTLEVAKAKGAVAQKFSLREVEAIEAGKTYFVNNVETGERLSVEGASRAEKARIGSAKASSEKSQKFRFVKAGSSYRLQNVRSLYCVGVAGDGAKTARQLSGSSDACKWAVKVDLKEAAFTIASKRTGARLDGASGKLALNKASDSASQRFTLTPTYAFKLYLNPGHGQNSNGNGGFDPGAIGNGHTEAEFTHDLARRVERLLAGTDVKVVNGERYGLAYWKRLPKAESLGCDAIVSIHFDAGGASGTLGMVGVQGKAAGSDTLSRIIREHAVAKLGLPDRGPVSRSDITCVNGPIPSMLLEVCFMDNYHDVSTYLAKRDAVARGLADGILQASRNRDIVR